MHCKWQCALWKIALRCWFSMWTAGQSMVQFCNNQPRKICTTLTSWWRWLCSAGLAESNSQENISRLLKLQDAMKKLKLQNAGFWWFYLIIMRCFSLKDKRLKTKMWNRGIQPAAAWGLIKNTVNFFQAGASFIGNVAVERVCFCIWWIIQHNKKA